MMLTIFLIAALVMSAVIHEVAHGFVAHKLGDDTAKDLGRLTLNPIKHLDPIGSIALPALMVLTGSRFLLAWAKPVPFNPNNLRDPQNDSVKVALAGPLSNLILVIIFGCLALILPIASDVKLYLVQSYFGADNSLVLTAMSGSVFNSLYIMSLVICLVNAMLFTFNLIPIPPLDGSKVLLRFLPPAYQDFVYRYESYGFIVLILLLWFNILGLVLMPIISLIISLFFL